MKFTVVPMRTGIPAAIDAAFLESNNWDDYGFKTLFTLRYRDSAGELHDIGRVKIGQFDIDPEQQRPSLPSDFEGLDGRFFSLGQDDSYYEILNNLGEQVRDAILYALNDIALNLELFDRALAEPVTGKSLLREVSKSTVRDQFHRISMGGARLSPFSFAYTYPTPTSADKLQPLSLAFAVIPESQPPTNVHVVIGRNGVGKSHLLNYIANVLVAQPSKDAIGSILFDSNVGSATGQFANLISVAFSAFDDFEPLSSPQNKSKGLPYAYIGLKRIARSGIEDTNAPKDSRALATEFGTSVKSCLQGSRFARWRRALEMLESDPVFADVQVAELADSASNDDSLRSRARDLFRNLSSGHKIVLLTVTRLVETIEEKSLVLLDEPESHLHPPLLAAFVRALSDLLINRNGVAIIATHSPVILQEVPRTCVWKLRRSGKYITAERPRLETFGENVGTLTQEVFGLEVTTSGFHKMLTDAINAHDSYSAVLEAFGGHLGGEARALVQGLLAAREAESGL